MFDIYKLLDYLNTHAKDATYSKIILYLLHHQKDIQHLTISQIAKACFVSPATMTRFCQYFDIPSFGDLRNTITSLEKMKSYSSLRMKETDFLQLQSDPQAYLSSYAEEIATALQDVQQSIQFEEIDRLLEKVHQAEELLLIGYSSNLELARETQSAFLSNKKVVIVPETEEIQRTAIQQATEKSMVMVISSYGTILNQNNDLITQIADSPATSVLLTQHTQNIFTNLFDYAVNVTTTNYVRIGNYPLTFFLEYFVRRYASLYT